MTRSALPTALERLDAPAEMTPRRFAFLRTEGLSTPMIRMAGNRRLIARPSDPPMRPTPTMTTVLNGGDGVFKKWLPGSKGHAENRGAYSGSCNRPADRIGNDPHFLH